MAPAKNIILCPHCGRNVPFDKLQKSSNPQLFICPEVDCHKFLKIDAAGNVEKHYLQVAN